MTVVVGIPGPQGIPGETGESAYQQWLAAGNTGTQAQFLASLVGAPGTALTVGTGAPSSPSGNVGDVYIDSASGNLWVKH